MRYPFALDGAGFDWKREGQCLTAKKTGIQVLPKDGSYEVCVVLAPCGGKAEENLVQTTCAIEAGTLRILDAKNVTASVIKEIRF